MIEKVVVNIFDNWRELVPGDYIEEMPYGKWIISKDLDAFEGDFLKIKHNGRCYLIHKANIAFIAEK